MGREGGFLTPKAVAKRLKAKGLGRQWLYCQMCRKQCRDENGFKCHCESEGHLRNMELFAEKGEQLVAEFSKKFEDKFMEYMRRCYRSVSVPPNVVYNQITRERNHVRMNGTMWATLSEFVEHLAKTGKCKIEETEKGPHLRYIEDTDHSETRFRQGLKRKRATDEASEIDRHEKEIQMQRERCLMEAQIKQPQSPEQESDQEIQEQMDEKPSCSQQQQQPQQGEVKVAFSIPKKKTTSAPVMNRLKEEQKQNRSWLCEGLIVKVLAKRLKNGAYYKKKGVVKKVCEKNRADIEMLESGEVIKVDEGELETVIPQIGRTVRVVNGSFAGCDAKLISCDQDKFSVSIEICSMGAHQGTLVPAVPYEDVCKIDELNRT